MVFVDDGSKDKTWSMISEMYEKNPYVMGIKSSKNRGHQNTLLEGLMTVKDDCEKINLKCGDRKKEYFCGFPQSLIASMDREFLIGHFDNGTEPVNRLRMSI